MILPALLLLSPILLPSPAPGTSVRLGDAVFSDGFESGDTSAWTSASGLLLVENNDSLCGDGSDNDMDGAHDCADSSCHGHPDVSICTENLCANSIDDDLDGATDCDDVDCFAAATCDPVVESLAAECSDSIDNDGDGSIDCQDLSCRATYAGCVETSCGDGMDNDGDGFLDCQDLDCLYSGTCPDSEVTDATCSDGLDNDSDGFSDCNDVDCQRSPLTRLCEGNAVSCADGLDNDGNLFADCDDFSCRTCSGFLYAAPTCAPCP